MFVIAMLMFTVLACSCGPSQEEFDGLKQQKERLSEEVEELNRIVLFVDGDITRTVGDGEWKRIYYLDGNDEIRETHHRQSQCYKDATISLPLPLSCKCGFRTLRTMEEILESIPSSRCVQGR